MAMPSQITLPLFVALAACQPNNSVSIEYVASQRFDPAQNSATTYSFVRGEASQIESALEWREVVAEVTRNHRAMQKWEKEATTSFIDSLFS